MLSRHEPYCCLEQSASSEEPDDFPFCVYQISPGEHVVCYDNVPIGGAYATICSHRLRDPDLDIVAWFQRKVAERYCPHEGRCQVYSSPGETVGEEPLAEEVHCRLEHLVEGLLPSQLHWALCGQACFVCDKHAGWVEVYD